MFISNFHSHPGGQGGGRIKSPVRGQGCQGEELSGVNRRTKTAGKIAGREEGARYLLTQTYVFPVCTPARSAGTRGPSVDSDIVFCHSCRETARIRKPRRELSLIDGNEKSYEVTTRKPSPISYGFESNLIPNPTLGSIFEQLFLTMS